jgi:hypothetical protein
MARYAIITEFKVVDGWDEVEKVVRDLIEDDQTGKVYRIRDGGETLTRVSLAQLRNFILQGGFVPGTNEPN